MSGYRVTFDASHKVKTGGHAQGFLQHVARDIDNANGVVMAHANPNIDAARTHLNSTVIPDGNGGWVRPSSVDQIQERLAARLATVKKPPRADAVIMRPIVANLSPEWFAEHNPDWRENGLNQQARAAYDALLAQAVEEYGWENIVVASLHLDESLPQWQIAVTPVTDDGRLTQKPWYPSPAALKAMGVRYREAVAATGIEVEMRPSERSTEHLSSDEFQRAADKAKADSEKVAAKIEEVNQYVTETIPKLRAKARAEGHDEGESEGYSEGYARGYESGRSEGLAEAREAAQAEVSTLRQDAATDAAQAAHDREQATQARRAAEGHAEALRGHVARLEAIPADVDRWLDSKASKDGRTFRDIYDRSAAERRQRRANTERLIAQHTQPDSRADDLTFG